MTTKPDRIGSPPALEGRALTLAYLIWFAAAVVAGFILIAALPIYTSRVDAALVSPEAVILVSEPVMRVTGVLSVGFSLLAALVSMGMSTLLVWRGERSFIVAFTSIFLVGFGVIITGPLEAAVLVLPDPFTPAFATVVWSAYFTFGVIWLFWIFPNGRYVPGWTRYMALPLLVISIVTSIVTEGLSAETPLGRIGQTIIMVVLVGGFAGQAYRYFRVSTVTERQQTRWVLVGIALMFAILGISAIGYTTDPAAPVTTWRRIGGARWSLRMSVIPLSLTVAVLRYRLWAVDLIIRRTLTYGLITLLLGLTYFGGVVMLQGAFVQVTGQKSPLAIVASTLVIAALFNPLHARVQTFIDRRFDRRKYDAQRTLEEFSARVRDQVDVAHLEQSLLNVVDQTMQPESVALWLVAEE